MLSNSGSGGAWGNVRAGSFGAAPAAPAGPQAGAYGGQPMASLGNAFAVPGGLDAGGGGQLLMSQMNVLSASPPRFADASFGGFAGGFAGSEFDRPSPMRAATGPADDAPPNTSIRDVHEIGIATPDRGRAGVVPGSATAQRFGYAVQATPPPQQIGVFAQPAASPFGGTPMGGLAATALGQERTTVVVFGFPLSAAAAVLAQFRDHGEILHHVVESDGNWMYIKYATRFSAYKALSRNGAVLQLGLGQSKCMVGVGEAPAEKDDELSRAIAASMPSAPQMIGAPAEERMPGGGNWDETPAPRAQTGLQPAGGRIPLQAGGTTSFGTPTRTLPPQVVNTPPPQPAEGGGVLSRMREWVHGW
ncbi:hypothetical protein DFJ74DRAFT_711672 [Hyaloraphidium curvatum]|nr:hypothetical protein DFJ74DRAFT_711672 [Hyaloraphidium curvatum]